MELTKTDTQMAKGIGALSMVMLHLFCRLGNLPYTPFLYLGDVPFVYYLGLFGDMCVPIYCFCSGYAHALIWEKDSVSYKKRLPQKAMSLLKNYWIVVTLFAFIGFVFLPESGIPGDFSTFFGNMLLYGMSYNGAWCLLLRISFCCSFRPALVPLSEKLMLGRAYHSALSFTLLPIIFASTTH